MVKHPECQNQCQYAKDVSMGEYSCVGECQYAVRDEGGVNRGVENRQEGANAEKVEPDGNAEETEGR